jgi:hypothetical protein
MKIFIFFLYTQISDTICKFVDFLHIIWFRSTAHKWRHNYKRRWYKETLLMEVTSLIAKHNVLCIITYFIEITPNRNRWCYGFMVLSATFNSILVISWRSVLLVEETGIPGENHWHAASHWQTLSHNVVSSTPRLNGIPKKWNWYNDIGTKEKMFKTYHVHQFVASRKNFAA